MMTAEMLASPYRTPLHASHGGREAVRDPLGYFEWLARTYGDIVQYRSTLEPAFLINRPDYIRHVLQSNGRNYDKNTFLNKYLLESVTGEGLLTSENPLWRQQRQLIQPAFHRRSLSRYETMMVGATAASLKRLETAAHRGEPVDIAAEMMHLTLDIVTRALFSFDIGEHAARIGEAMNDMTTIGKPRHRKVRAAIDYLDGLVYDIIQRRRASDARPDDLLTMLLDARYEDGSAMSETQVRDEVMALLIAGHETTANTLSWTWYLIAKHPDVAAIMLDEQRAVLAGRIPVLADFPQLTYTDQVIREAMRLYPSAWSMSRRAIGEDVIDGYFIPAGAIMAISPYVMHRHPDYWEDPVCFKPERFDAGRVDELPQFAYFPFGGGARKCIGQHFAMMESMTIVPAIAQRFRLHLLPEHPVEPHALVTLRPRYGILVNLERL